jgi:hypothetical protein
MSITSKKLLTGSAGFAASQAGGGIDVDSLLAMESYGGNGNQASAASSTRKTILTDHQLCNEIVVNGFSNDTSKEAIYTTPGTYSWTCPAGVTSVCVVSVGGGAGDAGGQSQGGGGLGWKNDIPVTPGSSYTVVVGRAGPAGWQGGAGLNNGGDSYFIDTSTVAGFGGKGYGSGNIGGGFVGDGGGSGGRGGYASGGGAGGYLGNGGHARAHQNSANQTGKGGAGGAPNTWASNSAGGGVGIYGAGVSGGAGHLQHGSVGNGAPTTAYGYGGVGSLPGGTGAVRIIWGEGRSFPFAAGYESELKEEVDDCLVWLKSRDNDARDHYLAHTKDGFFDPGVWSNQNYAQSQYADFLNAKGSGGLEIMHSTTNTQNQNQDGENYMAWVFKKKRKFFDIVEYTGTGSTQTINHSLDCNVGMIMIKLLNSDGNWVVWHRGQHSTSSSSTNLALNTNAGDTSPGGQWIANVGTSSFQITAGNWGNYNQTGYKYVAYIFAHNDGDGEFGPNADQDIIKCGSYTGDGTNNSSNVVDVGFEPQWLLVKKANGSGDWFVIDKHRGFIANDSQNSNGQDRILSPNNTYTESANLYAWAAPKGNGFALENSFSSFNQSGGHYIYMAIRRGPLSEPENGTDVWDVQYSTSAYSQTTPGFEVDLAIASSSTHYTFDRTRGQWAFALNNRDAEFNWGRDDIWDRTEGFSLGSDMSYYRNFQWRRAPGFFDIVTWKVDGTGNTTIPHSLGVPPEMIWSKNRSDNGFGSGSWFLAHHGLTGWDSANENDRHTFQDFGTAASTQQGYHRDFTDSSIRLISNAAGGYTTSHTCVAYLFASLDGVSKVGSYTGNGSSQTIDCGFSNGARFIIIKRYDSTGDWYVWDEDSGIVSGNDPHLSFNSTAAQVTSDDSVDPASSGFIVNQVSATNINVSNGKYIFYAIA